MPPEACQLFVIHAYHVRSVTLQKCDFFAQCVTFVPFNLQPPPSNCCALKITIVKTHRKGTVMVMMMVTVMVMMVMLMLLSSLS